MLAPFVDHAVPESGRQEEKQNPVGEGKSGARGEICSGYRAAIVGCCCRLGSSCFVRVVAASLRGVAVVLFACDCPQHIPSLTTARCSRGRLRLPADRRLLDLSDANSSPPGHPIQSDVLRPEPPMAQTDASTE